MSPADLADPIDEITNNLRNLKNLCEKLRTNVIQKEVTTEESQVMVLNT